LVFVFAVSVTAKKEEELGIHAGLFIESGSPDGCMNPGQAARQR